jgi:hypothetical protein
MERHDSEGSDGAELICRWGRHGHGVLESLTRRWASSARFKFCPSPAESDANVRLGVRLSESVTATPSRKQHYRRRKCRASVVQCVDSLGLSQLGVDVGLDGHINAILQHAVVSYS